MNVEQIYTGCLAQGAYYIHSNGEGVIIDPLREVQPYICLLYTSPSPRDLSTSRMPSSA